MWLITEINVFLIFILTHVSEIFGFVELFLPTKEL